MRIKGLQLITRRLPLKQEFISRVLFTPKIPLQLYQKHFSETTCRLQAEKSNDDALYFQHLFYEIHPKLKGPSVNINLQELNRNHENKLDQSVEEWTEKNTIRHKTRYETTKQPITSFETLKSGIIKQHDVLKTDQNQMESNKENIHQLKKIYASSENYKEQKQRYTLQSSPVSQVKESDLETNNQLDLSPHDHLSSSLEPEFIERSSPVSQVKESDLETNNRLDVSPHDHLSSSLEPEFIERSSPVSQVKESDLETNNQLDLTQKDLLSSYLEPEFIDHLSPVSQVKESDLETNNELDLLPRDPLSSSLEPEFIDNLSPVLSPSFNLAAYATRSQTLQELVKLGVDLSRIEKKAGLAKFVLKLDFEKNINNHIQFLHDLGVPSNELGTFLTHNPLIFKESLDDLQVRVNYLESKKFSKDAITRIVSKAPFWLSFSTKRIDRRLGFFQKEFQLTGDELRHVVTRLPKLALWGLHKVKQTNFSIKEEMGFSQEETKLLLIEKPKIWLVDRPCLLKKFDLIHNTMNIPHKQILRYPGVLLKREFLVRQRHLFLEKLGRAQYNPNEPQYVPLKALVAGTDAEFCNKYAKTSLHIFNEFLKTL